MSLLNRLPFHPALGALSFGLLAATASATPVTLTPVADTFITVHPALGGASSNHGSDASLFVISPDDANPNPVFSLTLVRFDLSALAGQVVQGPVTLSMYVQGTSFNQNVADRTIALKNIVGNWDEATVTANNNNIIAGAVIDQQSVHYLTAADNGYVSWTLPAAYVQTWIDAPLSNDGLFVHNLSGGPFNDLQFGSRESLNAPQLTVDVPEPGSLAVLGIAAGGLIGRRRRD